MFRFLQAFCWMLFCRQKKAASGPSKIHPYRIIPEGWCVCPEESEDEGYKVAQKFLLNEDVLACCATESSDDLELPQFWLLKGSKLIIDHVGDNMVTVVHEVVNPNDWKYLRRYTWPILPIQDNERRYEEGFAFDGESFFLTFDQLEQMTRLHD